MNYTAAILLILLLVTCPGPTRQDKVSTNEQFEELPSGVKADLFNQDESICSVSSTAQMG